MIELRTVEIRQGQFLLSDVSFSIPTGNYGVLMGKTGCGKSTILEAIAGLREIATGEILLNQVDVSRLPPAQRGIGYVPQDGALFKTMSVRANLGFALALQKMPTSQIENRVEESARWLEIEHLLDRMPSRLSGGEAQRVALGRAIIFRPKILLLDEPLSSLDEETRAGILDVLTELRQRREMTVLHVTHNSSEAERLADVRLWIDTRKVRIESVGGTSNLIPSNSEFSV